MTATRTPGWKFAQYEMKGVPVRLEIGPRDIENNSCVLVRRDNREKVPTSLEGLPTAVRQMLDDFAKAIYAKAKANLDGNITPAHTVEQMKEILRMAGRFDDIPEKLNDAAGVTAGCTPAFTYMFIEALADGAVMAGVPRAKAMEYAAQAVMGAAALVLESGQQPGALKTLFVLPGLYHCGVAKLEEGRAAQRRHPSHSWGPTTGTRNWGNDPKGKGQKTSSRFRMHPAKEGQGQRRKRAAAQCRASGCVLKNPAGRWVQRKKSGPVLD